MVQYIKMQVELNPIKSKFIIFIQYTGTIHLLIANTMKLIYM